MSKDKTEELAEAIVGLCNAVEAAVVNAKMQIAKMYGAAAPQSQQTQNEAPLGVDLAGLPWKSYKTKEAAAPDEPAWVFSNARGAEPLAALLKAKGEKAVVGDFEYQLQGPQKQFIARRPIKK